MNLRYLASCVAVLLFVAGGRAEAPFVIYSGGNWFWAQGGVPDDAFQQLGTVTKAEARLRCLAFSRDGNWVLQAGRNSYYSNNGDLSICKKLSELQKNADFRCVAFAPAGGWTIFFGGNGSLTEGKVPEAAYKKIVEVGKKGAVLRSVAYGPRNAWVLLYNKKDIAYGNVPKALAAVLNNAVKKQLTVRCVAFTGDDWICLADKDWWTSDANLAAAKMIDQCYRDNHPAKWVAFVPVKVREARSVGLEAAVDAAAVETGITADTPGVAVAVVDGNKVVFRKGYGMANLANKTPIRPETTFEIASLSKEFAGMAVAILHDRGKLSFDEPARKYIPELPEFDADHPIRIRDLLNHTSGLPDYTGWSIANRRDPRFSGNEDYAHAIRDNPKLVELTFPTGEKYAYSNTNYMLAALIVARVSHKSYSKFLHDEVFVPLGMTRSWVYDHPREAPKDKTFGYLNALGYAKNGEGVWSPCWGSPPFRTETMLTAGDGAVWTSVLDMARWDVGLRDNKLLKPATWKEYLKPSKTRDGATNNYGFGLCLARNDKGRVTEYGHGGAWGGFGTGYNRYVTADYAVIFFGNGIDYAPVSKAVIQHMEKSKSKLK